jgi:hypothetical protein
MAIADAEESIATIIGYYPTPQWVEEEYHQIPVHHRPEYGFGVSRYDVSLSDISLIPKRSKLISGGRRVSSLVEAGVAVTYSDTNSDGWNDLATITLSIPATITDAKELKVYFAGYGGDRTYEIRHPKTKTFVDSVLTLTFNTWMMIDPDFWEEGVTDDSGSQSVDLTDTTKIVSTVDVYREYNDDTQAHVEFRYDNPLTGEVTSQNGYLYRSGDERSFRISPGTYDTDLGTWVASAWSCMDYTYAKLWYYCGDKDMRFAKPNIDDYLPLKIERAISFLATARLDKLFYTNTNATSKLHYYQVDLAESPQGTFRFVSDNITKNPFGTRRGEVLAWNEVNNFVQREGHGAAV